MPKEWQLNTFDNDFPSQTHYQHLRQQDGPEPWAWSGVPGCAADDQYMFSVNRVEFHQPQPSPPFYEVEKIIENATHHYGTCAMQSDPVAAEAKQLECVAEDALEDPASIPASGHWLEHTWAFLVRPKLRDDGTLLTIPPPQVNIVLSIRKFVGSIESRLLAAIEPASPPGSAYGRIGTGLQFGVKIHGNVPAEVNQHLGRQLQVDETWMITAPEILGEGEEADIGLSAGNPQVWGVSSHGRPGSYAIVRGLLHRERAVDPLDLRFKANSGGGVTAGFEPFYVTFYADLRPDQHVWAKATNLCDAETDIQCEMDHEFLMREG